MAVAAEQAARLGLQTRLDMGPGMGGQMGSGGGLSGKPGNVKAMVTNNGIMGHQLGGGRVRWDWGEG